MKKITKVLSLMLAVILLCGMFTVGSFAASSPFKDVKSSRWSYQYIKTLYDAGIVNGKTTTTFVPEDNVTRAEFVKMLGGVEGINPKKYTTTQFTDVKKNAWYAGYVAWAVKAGITTGTTDTTFAPDANITREQMAAMIYRYATNAKIYLPATETAISFKDSTNISSYAKKAVAAMQKAGIISGEKVSGGYKFSPKNNATREQAAKMLCVLFSYNGGNRENAFNALKAWIQKNTNGTEFFYNHYDAYIVEVENATNNGNHYTAEYCIFYDEEYDEIGIAVNYYEDATNRYISCGTFLTKGAASYYDYVDRYTVQAGVNIEADGEVDPAKLTASGFKLTFDENNLYGDYAESAEYVAASEATAQNLMIVVAEYTDLLIFSKHLTQYSVRDFGFYI